MAQKGGCCLPVVLTHNHPYGDWEHEGTGNWIPDTAVRWGGAGQLKREMDDLLLCWEVESHLSLSPSFLAETFDVF